MSRYAVKVYNAPELDRSGWPKERGKPFCQARITETHNVGEYLQGVAAACEEGAEATVYDREEKLGRFGGVALVASYYTMSRAHTAHRPEATP